MSTQENNRLYYKLYEEMEGDICPICSLVKKSTDLLMDNFLYENVNDVSLRKVISNGRGFCNYHSRILMEKGDPLAHALIYKDLINLAAKDIKRNRYDLYNNHKECIFCKQAERAESEYVSAFSEAFSDEKFRDKYKLGGLICMEHMKALSDYDFDYFSNLEEITEEKYKNLVLNLDEIIQKHDYRFCNLEYSEGAKDSWRRAVGIINDGCGIRK